MMEDKKVYTDERFEKILQGIKKARKKLVETSAANNEDLVISDKEGNVKKIPAKDLLRGLE
jgi:hypothetical protein